MTRRPIAVVLVALTVAAACTPASPDGAPAPAALTVYAAASLKGAMEEIVPVYARAVPGVTLTVSTAASSALRAQIEQGAPADVFLSADTAQPAALADAGLAAGDAWAFAGNRLAIVVPTDDPAGIDTPADLAHPGVKIMAAGQAVPITRYADKLVANLAALDGYPAGFLAAYRANVVSREDDVRAVIAKIELAEGDAAIVYQTDALASDGVVTIDVPPEADVAAPYAGVAIKASAHPAEAAAFLDWLTGSEGQSILASLGFSPAAP